MTEPTTETAGMTAVQREALRKAIQTDLSEITSMGHDGAPSAEWVAWFLTNGWPRRTPKVIDQIIAEHVIPPGRSVQ